MMTAMQRATTLLGMSGIKKIPGDPIITESPGILLTILIS